MEPAHLLDDGDHLALWESNKYDDDPNVDINQGPDVGIVDFRTPLELQRLPLELNGAKMLKTVQRQPAFVCCCREPTRWCGTSSSAHTSLPWISQLDGMIRHGAH